MVRESSHSAATLTRERIVRLAIARADAGGLERVSMRKLATELSVTPMALYWHFANRDALLDAMAERVAGKLVYKDDPGAPWQARLRGVLTATLALFQQHPWLGPLARRRIVPAPNFLGALEVLLDTVRAAGFSRQAAATVVDFAIDSLAAVAAEFPPATARNPKPRAPSERQLTMRRQLADLGSEYPRIREAAAPLTTSERPRVHVKLGIDILVRGIESSAPKKQRS
jgi:TetR/AcrR family transcriptional regulator, tetracycline repressor protein